MTDIFTSDKRRELMARVKNKNTNIELAVRKRLWRLGYRFRTSSNLFGKPDIVFRKKKVVIFCDGDFWHGKKYIRERGGYKKFWRDKIALNIKRDKEVSKKLKNEGWTVLRFWKTDILKNLDRCIEKIVHNLNN